MRNTQGKNKPATLTVAYKASSGYTKSPIAKKPLPEKDSDSWPYCVNYKLLPPPEREKFVESLLWHLKNWQFIAETNQRSNDNYKDLLKRYID